MATPRHLLVELARWVEEEAVEYAVVGGIAVVRYGYVRETKDIDLLVAMPSLEKLANRLTREGFSQTATDGINFRVYRRGPKQRIDLLLANNSFHRRVLGTRSPVEIAGRTLYFATLEHLVAMKLKAHADDPDRRGRDLVDVRQLLDRSDDSTRRRIESVIRVFGREDLL